MEAGKVTFLSSSSHSLPVFSFIFIFSNLSSYFFLLVVIFSFNFLPVLSFFMSLSLPSILSFKLSFGYWSSFFSSVSLFSS